MATVVIPSPRSGAAESGVAVAAGGGLGFAVVRGQQQDVVRTGARRAEPRAWLRSVVWLVGAGLHPKAGPTTLVVARDLASRMDFRRGIVLYDLEGTARRVGVSVATVKRHVAVLRELGALVWLVHGSKRNLRLPGRAYTATATVYGAVIPPVYDAAMGHRLSGSGYEARVCGVTDAGRERAVAAAASKANPVDNQAVDNSSSAARAPHSLGRYHRSPEAEVEGSSKDTSRKRASRSTASPRTQKSNTSSGKGPRRTAGQVRRSVWITRQVRARVNWTQSERLRRLEFVLRPFTDAGWDADTIAAELHSWMLTWRPARPAAFIRVQLAQQAAAVHQAEQFDTAEGWDEIEASGAFIASRPDLVRSVLDGLAQGMAAYSARQAEQGLDDLTGADAAADMAAFLTGVPA
ncbi:cell wall protein (plasmid) [Streptomyces scopuliridis]|uniref:cell wall protein n=1 Tax=Streptomyces scopuliridis TaxID=452529 RepID=UPI002DD90AC1|nr:cell wall protein [Streptomyces scopuliridis]WSB39158.1 cell wall protein [Streptomyces scopuliridis]